MSKSKEYVSTSSDDSEEEPKPRKKQKKMKQKDDEPEKPKSSKVAKKESKSEEENVWDLGLNRKVTVREFKGKIYVDIREMYYDNECNLKPGKKGIALSTTQWRNLLSIVDEVDKCVKSKG